MLLNVGYSRAKRYEQALNRREELNRTYPRNLPFELAQASVYRKMQKWDDAERVYEQILAKIHAKKDGYERLRQARVLSALGTNDVDSHQFERAMDTFKQVISATDATVNEKGRAQLWLGKLFDSEKDRSKALENYE